MALLDSLLRAATQERRSPQASPAPDAEPIARAAPSELGESPALRDGWLTSVVQAQDGIAEHGRQGRGNYVHVSSLVDFCARQYVLAHRYESDVRQSWTGGHKVAFAMGRAAEDHVRSSIIAARDGEGVWGMWSCRCGHAREIGGLRRSRTCDRCQRPLEVHQEPVLRNYEHRIIGRPDLTLHEGRLHHKVVVEIKSMSADRWEALRRPVADHVLQALLYRWLYQQANFRVHDRVVLFYVGKHFRWGSPYKEFHVDATETQHVEAVRSAVQMADQVRDSMQDGTLPEREVCTSQDCARARNCPVRTLCFSL